MGSKENNIRLRDTARQILDLVPVDAHVYSTLHSCLTLSKPILEENLTRLKNFYISTSPTQMLYNLKATLVLLVPVIPPADLNELELIYRRFISIGCLTYLLNIVTQKQILDQYDIKTRKSIYSTLFYILRRFLIILGFYQLKTSNASNYNESLEQILNLMAMSTVTVAEHHATVSLEKRIAMFLLKHNNDHVIPKGSFLQYNHIIDFMRLIWCSASHNKQMSFDINIKTDFNAIHQTFKPENVSFNSLIQEFN